MNLPRMSRFPVSIGIFAGAAAIVTMWSSVNCGIDSGVVLTDGGIDGGRSCNSDSQCGKDEVCLNRFCVPAGTCLTSKDCKNGEECVKNRCEPSPDGGEADGSIDDGSIQPDGAQDGGETDGGATVDGGQDAGADAGDGGLACTGNDGCPKGHRCGKTTGLCEPAAIISVEPATVLDFEAVAHGAAVKKPVKITNKGKLPLNLTSFELLNPPDKSCFTIASGQTAVQLLEDQEHAVEIEYVQNGADADVGAFKINSSDAEQPVYQIAVRSTYADLPDFALYARDTGGGWTKDYPKAGDAYEYPVDFGYVSQWTTRSLVYGIKNETAGNAILVLKDLSAAGAPKNQFAAVFRDGEDPLASNALPVPDQADPATHLYLGPGEMIFLHASYNAQIATESDSRDFTLTSSDQDMNNSGEGSGTPVTFKMSARSRPSKIEVNPLAMDFKEVLVGSTSKKTVTVTNQGLTDLNILASSGLQTTSGTGYQTNPATLTRTIAPKTSFQIEVAFTPAAAGVDSNNLVIDSDDADLPKVTVSLTGKGTEPSLKVVTSPAYAGTPPVLDFGMVLVGSKTTGNATVTNTGTGNLVVSGVPLVQGSPAYFAITGVKKNGNPSAFPMTIGPQSADALTFSIDFTPAAIGAHEASMVFKTSDLKQKDFTIGLKGNAGYDKGQACGGADECMSGFCTDTVCCETACDVKCHSCAMAGYKGTCRTVDNGSPDPRGVCHYSPPTGCGNTGNCTGGDCEIWPPSTVCAGAACNQDNSGLKQPRYCAGDGSKACADSAETSCSPYICDPTLEIHACKIACFSAFDCAPGYACDGENKCKLANGRQCQAGSNCASASCVDGYCCNEKCDQACEVCNAQGLLGTCSAAEKGVQDPREKCAVSDASTCKSNGKCDGSRGSCALWDSSTVCSAASCNADNSASINQKQCDGSGNCASQGQTACTPYSCDTAAGLCRTDCGSDQDCAANLKCHIAQGQARGACRLGPGQQCLADSDCHSEFCTDGVCCNERCGQACEKCDLAATVGTCSAVASGFNDPRGKCATEDKATCGYNGKCSGTRGVCRKWDVTTVCENPKCTDNDLKLQLTRKCDGNGACIAGVSADCTPYLCDPSQTPDACRTLCIGHADCAPDHACDFKDFTCKLVNGQACSGASDCVSGFCADGLCCNEACNQPCETCNQTALEGTCTGISIGVPDPRGKCVDAGAASCKTNGLCSGVKGTCQLYLPTTVCQTAKCNTDKTVSHGERKCSGTGTCVNPVLTSCPPFSCDTASGLCFSSCTGDQECSANAACLMPPASGPTTGACRYKNGEKCVSDTECYSGFCADGLCCDEKCDKPCESCNQEGLKGACTALAAGDADPEAKCIQADQSTCGLDGYCAGTKGSCRQWVAGTQCLAPFCNGDTANLKHVCDGAGACLEGNTQDCTPFTCAEGACRTSCASNADCAASHSCNTAAGVCLRNDGLACTADSQCFSGFCTDGYCCNQRCGGTCEKCSQAGRLGFCDPIPADSDPDNECPVDDPSTCNKNGNCSGVRTCKLHVGGTECMPSNCVGDSSNLAHTCDGLGACTEGGVQDCTPYACKNGACRTSCSNSTDCALNHSCNTAQGKCFKNDGQACSTGAECYSGFCTDGVCCKTACSGVCESCSQAGRLGFCDPVAAGADPLNECDDQGQASCGTTGVCSGQRNCQLYAQGSECLAASCSGDSANLAHTCSGAGACNEGGVQNCVPYTCSGGACKTSCSANTDCAADYSCDTASHQCLKNGGLACGSDGECLSGFCTDGVCCDARCHGICEKCSLAGRVGFCDPIPVDTDPDSECFKFDKSTCKQNGDCSGGRTCKLYTAGTECAAASCQGDMLAPADTCNGAGSCIDNGLVSCGSYTCSGTACKTSCAINADCAAYNSCKLPASACLKNDGQTCSIDAECFNGFCTDGVCCSSRCHGTCEKCSLQGYAGSCIPIPDWTDPDNECPDDGPESCDRNGVCNGNRACRLYGAGTECVAATCAGDSVNLADKCDGSGTCADSGTQSCVPFSCLGGECRTSCTSTLDCASGFTCHVPTGKCLKNNGLSCGIGTECVSGYCTDGVCCNEGCAGLCEKCSLAGSEGMCIPVPPDTDPDNECPEDAVSTCQRTGKCSGARSCKLQPYGTECAAPSCTGDTLNLADSCSGTGTCVDGGSLSCIPYTCAAGACKTSCASNSDCAVNYLCDTASGVCKKGNGLNCWSGTECFTNFCTDGVCCNARCWGTCEKCNTAGNKGSCEPVAAGADPDEECPDEGAPSCGRNGLCNGLRSCSFYAAGTECASSYCSGNVLYLADKCDGSGACQDYGSQLCAPYVCSAGACKTSCDTNADCAPNNTCISHQCLKNIGQGCGTDGECASGFCTDSVCCSVRCGGFCERCNKSGTCAAVAVNTDPDNECPDDGAGTCDRNGMCDGSRACKLYASGTVCENPNCAGSMLNNAHTCDGNGNCQEGGATDCSPFSCVNNMCTTTCTGSSDCAPGYSCNTTTHVCLKNNGVACMIDGECFNNYCTDGVCCENRCSGTCRRCDLAGSEGACSYSPAGGDPDNECTDQGASTCQKNGYCNGSGACRLYPAGTECAPASCQGDSVVLADKCDGNGTCVDYGVQSCAPYTCAAGTCKTSCATTNDCATNYTCIGNTCKKNNGLACSAGSECANGNCVDGVCCNNGCSGTCENCNLPGSSGTCTAIPAGTDPNNECDYQAPSTCMKTGECSGGSSCKLYPSGTDCVAASCSGSTTLERSHTCNGSGTCQDNGTQDCTPFVCRSGACLTACNSPSDCAPNHACDFITNICKLINGLSCSGDSECVSGKCVDGVCCDSWCNIKCEKCNMAGYLGICSAVPQNTDPDGDCDDDGAASCGLNGYCSGNRSCLYYPGGTVCASASCSGDSRILPKTCNGSGTCMSNGSQSCSPYSCSAGVCLTACTNNADCASGFGCHIQSGQCRYLNGQLCGSDSQCASGYCTDGLCCAERCNGICRKCNQSGREGYCDFVPAGTVSEGDCSQELVITCGRTGACDGNGGCQLYSSGTECIPTYCAGTYLNKADLCNGSGACVDQGYVNCAPYTCNGTACNTSCNSNLDCAPGNTCLGAPGGVCKVNNGEPCNADSQCLNNFCTDGVCCDARCGGLCEKCNLVNQLGLCKPVPNGADPDIECEEDPVSTCQHDGYCDGAKKCALYAPYTQCKSAGCYGDEYRNADVCDGNGNCVDNGGWSCVPYTCVNGACKTSCASSLDCASGYSCMSGVCLRNNGQPCSAGSQCYSNYCADGVCCDGDCLGLCRKCNFAGHVGTCTYAPVDTDPEENCAQDPVSTCGRNGDCDGNGGCKKYPVNTECIPIHCSEDFNHVHLASKCDGSGACVDGGSVSCEPYACGSGACKTSCALNSDCFTGYSCYAGACKKNLGVSCSGNSDCASNHCADGVCCEAACDGTCEKCNLPAREGHCDPIQDGTDLDNECTQGDVSNCGQDGWCNGARQCRKYIMGTVCVQPACSGPYTLLNISMCDGQGTCVSGGSTSCSPYVCSTAGGSPACKTSCSGDYECAPGYGCSGGLCKLNNGGLCNTAGECKSGWCTDHVCCDGPCGNLCERCDLQGHVGQCTYAPSGSDPDNECDDDGVTSCQHNGKCDGIGNCQLYPAGAVCSPAHCDGSSLHLAGTCAGTGAACADNGTEDCLPYNCFGGACLTSCSYDYDCSTGFRCNTGTHTCMKGIGQSCTTGSECYDGYCCNNKCTDLNEPNNCGSCGNVCQQVHGTNNCYYGTCGPQCDTGYGNCDGNGNNGCETDFSSSPNSCGNAVDLGSTCSDDECYDGFLGCDNATWTVHSNKSGITSKWFKVRFLECESDFWCCADLTGKLFLNVPPGVDYNLYAYSSCGTLWHQSTKGTGQSEAITITHHGGCDGNDDSFDVYIEVRYISGENCGGWTLTVQGQSC